MTESMNRPDEAPRGSRANDRGHITLMHLYRGYRYPVHRTTHPKIPKYRCSGHPLTTDYNTWRVYVETYVELLYEHLCEGRKYKLPQRLGALVMRKARIGVIDWKAGREALESGKIDKGEFVRKYSVKTDGYAPVLRWTASGCGQRQHRNIRFLFARISKPWYMKLYRECLKDRSILYRYDTEGRIYESLV